jgi:hypothetical protein
MTLGSRRSARNVLFGLTLGLCLSTRIVLADEADAGTRMAARELAVAGAEAFDKQDFATALDRFRRAEALYKAPSIAIMTARCFARVGRLVEAVDKYEETLRVPLDATAPEAFQRAVADATSEVEAVRARVPRLELRLPAEAPADLEVKLDDKLLPAALLGVPTPVNPGLHHVAARAAGREPFSSDITLPEGARQTLELSLAPLRSVAPAPAPAAPPVASPSSHHPSTLGVGLLVGGGVALAAGAVTGVVAMNRKSSLDAACKPGCPSNMASDIHAFRLNRTLSYVGFGVGLAAAGAGTYLLLHTSASGTEVGALVLPGSVAVEGSF